MMTKLFFIVLIIAGFSLNKESVYDNYKYVNIEKIEQNLFLTSYKKTFVIFLNDYVCFDCVKEIVTLINNIKTNDVDIVILINTNPTSIQRRTFLHKYQNLFPKKSRFLFTNTYDDKMNQLKIRKNLFEVLKIKHTPSILLYDNNNNLEIHLYQYSDIFNNQGKIRKESSVQILNKIQ